MDRKSPVPSNNALAPPNLLCAVLILASPFAVTLKAFKLASVKPVLASIGSSRLTDANSVSHDGNATRLHVFVATHVY